MVWGEVNSTALFGPSSRNCLLPSSKTKLLVTGPLACSSVTESMTRTVPQCPHAMVLGPLCYAGSCHLCWSCFCSLCDKLSESKKSMLFLYQPNLAAFLNTLQYRQRSFPKPQSFLWPERSEANHLQDECRSPHFVILAASPVCHLPCERPPEVWYLVYLSDRAQFSGPKHSLWPVFRQLEAPRLHLVSPPCTWLHPKRSPFSPFVPYFPNAT